MGQEAAPVPISWQPAWLVHTERGDAGGGVAELGARLPLPAYGLALCGDIGPDATLEDLAAEYAQARSYAGIGATRLNVHASLATTVWNTLVSLDHGKP